MTKKSIMSQGWALGQISQNHTQFRSKRSEIDRKIQCEMRLREIQNSFQIVRIIIFGIRPIIIFTQFIKYLRFNCHT